MKKLEKKWMSLMEKQSLILNNFVIILFFISFSFSSNADTSSIYGKTEIIDGDTIKIKNQNIDLLNNYGNKILQQTAAELIKLLEINNENIQT